jgi:large subunit ribosomal protein L17
MKRKKLGRKKGHREALLKNLLRSLFDHNYVVTTTAKAKALKREATSLIEKGKTRKENSNFKKSLKNILGTDDLVNKYEEYLKKQEAAVGFVRVGFRSGDNAEMSRVFLLGLDKKKSVVKKSKKEDKKEDVDKPKPPKGGDNPLKEDLPTKVGEKKVDKTAVVKKPRRAKARAGL